MLVYAPGTNTPVGLFGGCEFRIINGPVFMDKTYHVTRELVGKVETRGTEFKWIRSSLIDTDSGNVVADMTLQEMLLKKTFKDYAEYRALLAQQHAPTVSKL